MTTNNRLSGLEAYQMYKVLQLHFKGSLDYHKTNTKIGNKKQFEKVKGKIFFDRLAKRYREKDLKDLLIANFLVNPNMWVKDISEDIGVKNHNEYLRRTLSLSELFREDLNKILKHCNVNNIPYNEVFVCPDRKMPSIVNMVTNEVISIETFCVLDKLMKITPYLNRDLDGDPIWNNLRDKVWVYRDFIECDLLKMYDIANKIFKGN
jgi:hypothetical protein